MEQADLDACHLSPEQGWGSRDLCGDAREVRDFLGPGLPPQSPKLILSLHFLFHPGELPGGH